MAHQRNATTISLKARPAGRAAGIPIGAPAEEVAAADILHIPVAQPLQSGCVVTNTQVANISLSRFQAHYLAGFPQYFAVPRLGAVTHSIPHDRYCERECPCGWLMPDAKRLNAGRLRKGSADALRRRRPRRKRHRGGWETGALLTPDAPTHTLPRN